jgi:predicted AAA+ superfamily ATPase
LDNTRRFVAACPPTTRASGARGIVFVTGSRRVPGGGARRQGQAGLKLVEIHREDIASLPACLAHLRAADSRFIVFCDDLSFDKDDTSYKSLKAVLEGGIEGRPENVLFYATSNRRHLMPRDMMENERSTAINPSEAEVTRGALEWAMSRGARSGRVAWQYIQCLAGRLGQKL